MRLTNLGLIAISLLVVHAWASFAGAQEPQPVESPLGGAAPGDLQPLREQTIYIPYSKLRGIFEKEGRGVFLPYEEFQELWRKAREATPQAPEPKPPVDALITEIHSEAVVEKDVVRVTARIKIEVLREGWHEVPLRLGDAAILSAELADGPARVTPGDGYRLLLDKKGREPAQYQLTLQYAKAFNKAPGQNSVSFQAPRAPVNRWRIRVPQAGVKVNVHPRLATTEGDNQQDTQDRPPGPRLDETVVLAFVGAAEEVRIDWTPKAEGATGLAALATVQAQQEITIDTGVIRTQTRLDYDISRAEVTQLLVEVPADHKVVNVYDPNVRSWEFARNGDTQTITVELFEPTRGAQSIVVELEKFSDDLIKEPVSAPVVRGLNVGRQQGLVVVRLSSDLRAETSQRLGLLQLDAAELPPSLARQKWDFSYRYASLPFELTLDIAKVEPRIQAQQLVEAYLQPDQITLELFAVYEIDRAGVFQLDLDIPSGFDIRQVRGQEGAGAEAAAYDSHHVQGDEATRLRINLSRKALGRVGLFVELQKRLNQPDLLSPTGQTADVSVPIPRVAADSVERVNGKLILYAPESLRVRSGQTDGLQTISFGDALQQIPSLRGGRFQGLREILAYAYSRQPTSLVLSVQRRKPQVTARQLLVAGVESGVIRYQATFFYEILYSGVESLRLDVPEALASEMNLTAKTVQFAPIEPPPADVAAGYVAWSLTGETEFLGASAFEFNWEQKIDELGVGKSLDVTLPIIRPMDVDRAWGQVAIRKAENVDVRETGELVGLRPIDPQTDLMPGAAVEDAARAFEFHDDWLLQIKATRYELEEVKRTSIERAVLRMVVGHDRKTSVQALYRVRTARQRLEVQLPAKFDPNKGFNLNPLRINGQSTELERGEKGEYYVPLVNQNPETPFLLELRYTVDSGYERLEFPVFPSDPAVQKVYMCVYLPEELALLGSRGPWTSEFANRWRHVLYDRPNVNPDDKDMVRWVTNGIPLNVDPSGDFQIQGRLHTFSTLRPQPPPQGSLRLMVFNKDGLNALVFLLITAPGVIMVVLPLGTRLLVVGLLLIGLVLSGVFLPTFSLQVMDEVLLIAVLLVLAVWILMFLVRFSRQRVVALAGAGGPVAAIHSESPPMPSAPAKRSAHAANENSSPVQSDRPTVASDEHPSDQERDQEKGGSPDA